ncbi:MAG: hypothetical protein IJ524_07385 [Bacteroidales bacterium]|nr:hypothetical protein [Bacteroidales bacterium]
MLLTDYPWYFVLLCLLAGVAYAAVLYFVGRRPFRRGWRWGLAALRCLAVSAIAFLLLAPMSRQHVDERQKPHVVLAQDVSGSVRQGTDSAFSLQALVPGLEERCRVSYVEFGNTSSTDIGAVLERYRGDDVAALVLASDGLHNRGTNPTSIAERLQFPVHCLAMGDTTPRRDAWLANLRCNRIAMRGASFPVELTVGASLLRGRAARLVIRDDGGRQLFSREVAYTDDDFGCTVDATLPADAEGLRRYTAVLSPVDGEQTEANNSLSFYVDVIDSRRKVVLVANAPHPDLAALKRAIEDNPNYEASVVTAAEAESGKWKAEKDVSLVVLHNLPSRSHPSVAFADGLPQLFVIGMQTDLARFNALHSGLEISSKVQKANEVTALHRPAFALFALDEGDAAVFEALPPLTAPFGEARLAPDVQTLFAARLGNIDSRQPLVAATAQGEHRRAWIWGEGLWRWRLADWQLHESHAHVDRLVSQLVSFTALQSDRNRLQVEARRSYAEGEPVVLRAVLYNENYEVANDAEVSLHLKGDSVEADYLFRRDAGGYSLTLPSMAEGLYRYKAAADGQVAEGSFAVEALNLEQQHRGADHSLLATVAALSGGELYAPTQLPALREALSALKPTIYTHTRYAEFLRLPLVLALLLLLLAVEWVLRKYHGEL